MLSLEIAQHTAQVLREGGVIAYPTEAVWGFGCDPFNETAVQKLIDIKQRPFEKGVLLVADSIQRVEPWLKMLDQVIVEKMLATWPGPFTWVVPNNGVLPAIVTGGRETVALRVSAHEGVKQICEAFDGLVVSTSANRSGEDAITSEAEVHCQFGTVLDYIVPGILGGATSPSSIFDAISGQQLR